MKKIWIYLLGVLTGAVVTIIVLAIIGTAKRTNGMSFFESPGDIMDISSVEVFQSLGDCVALAHSQRIPPKIEPSSETVVADFIVNMGYDAPIVLLYNEDGYPYYDDQIVTAPEGKCFRQVGIYRYPTKSGIDKTVPIVMILDE